MVKDSNPLGVGKMNPDKAYIRTITQRYFDMAKGGGGHGP